jgi:hypothetical protein
MQPELGEMEIAVLPALDPTFTTYRLEMDRAAQAPPSGVAVHA